MLIRPIITEKTTKLSKDHNFYTFQVSRFATKPKIARDVKELYGVKVIGVRTVNLAGKTKHHAARRSTYHTSPTKKALIQLATGQTLDLFQPKKTK